MSQRDIEVAEIIRKQLGGRQFETMTGAKNFMAIDNGLQFDLPKNFAKKGINRVRVVLDPNDTYTLEFWKIGNRPTFKATKEAIYGGLYADGLRPAFEEDTGLHLSLGTMGGDPKAEAYKHSTGSGLPVHPHKTGGHTPLEGAELPLEHIAEYDGAAKWCAVRGLKGKPGDPLPPNMDTDGALKYINADPEAFQQRVRESAYALVMEKRSGELAPTSVEPKRHGRLRSERVAKRHKHRPVSQGVSRVGR